MMQINCNEAKIRPYTGFAFDFAGHIEVKDYGYQEYSLPGEAHVSGRMLTQGEGLFPTELCFDAEAEMVCSRCGRPFRFPVSGAVTAMFAADARDDIEGEQDIYPLPDGRADLGRVVANEIGLLLPMQPLCREDCAGLCPCCGVDRNQSSCDCAREAVDPRWEKLKHLMQD